MALALAATGSAVLALFFGLFIGYQVGQGPRHSPPPKPLSDLADDLRDLAKRIERQLARHGKALARDVTELVNVESLAACSKVLGRLIDAHQAFAGEIREYTDGARTLQNEVVRTIVEGELALPVEPVPEKEPDFPGDRRKESRHPYFCKQWIAPYSGNRLPELEEFEFVQCRDLSSNGISFFLEDAPETDMVIVRLHGLKGAKYLTARIEQTTRSSNAEYGRYVVGCRFLGTLHTSAIPAGFEDTLSGQPSCVMVQPC